MRVFDFEGILMLCVCPFFRSSSFFFPGGRLGVEKFARYLETDNDLLDDVGKYGTCPGDRADESEVVRRSGALGEY